MLTLLVAATPVPSPSVPPQLDRFTVQPGPVALLIVVLLGVAMAFLGRSLVRRVRRIDFDDTGQTDEERARGRRRPPLPPQRPGRP